MDSTSKGAYAMNGRERLMTDGLVRKYVMRIRDLSESGQPREKLAAYGAESLTSSELMAAILGTGTGKETASALSERVFREYGEKAIAFQRDPKTVGRDFGIPLSKACQLVAAFELGRRFFGQNGSANRILRTSRQAFEFLKGMESLPKEQLRGLYLDSRFRLIHEETISVGSLTANIVHPREVFRPAIERNAAAVIIAHNHPSGSSKPTGSDIAVTRQLCEAGRILGIDLLDHIVIGRNGFSSIPPENKGLS